MQLVLWWDYNCDANDSCFQHLNKQIIGGLFMLIENSAE